MEKSSFPLGKLVIGSIVVIALLAFGWYLAGLDGRIAIVTSGASTPTNTEVSMTATIPPITPTETTVAPSALNPQAEQARAFAEPILQAIANRPPDYEYDFSKPENGWISGSDDTSTRDYVDGEYVVTVKPNGGTGAGPGKDFIFSDFVAEVDARIVSAADPGGWGFIFREQPFPQSFRYHINFDNIGMSLFLDTGSYTDLFSLQGAPVQPAPESNHLLVIAKGPDIAIYINGEPVTVVSHMTLSSGIVSLGIHAGEQETEVHFDNFKIWDISDLADATPGSQADQARAFAEPILQAIANRAPDFQDDFSSDNKGWVADNWEDFHCGQIIDGRIRLGILTDRMIQLSDARYTCGAHLPAILTVTNFVFEIDLIQAQSEIQGFAGVQWRHTNGYYRVAVDIPGHRWTLVRSSSGSPGGVGIETLQEWQGPTSGRIRVMGRGNQFAVYVNEIPVFYLEDDLNPDGEIDLWLNAPDGPVTIEYDNVKLWNLDKVSGPP